MMTNNIQFNNISNHNTMNFNAHIPAIPTIAHLGMQNLPPFDALQANVQTNNAINGNVADPIVIGSDDENKKTNRKRKKNQKRKRNRLRDSDSDSLSDSRAQSEDEESDSLSSVDSDSESENDRRSKSRKKSKSKKKKKAKVKKKSKKKKKVKKKKSRRGIKRNLPDKNKQIAKVVSAAQPHVKRRKLSQNVNESKYDTLSGGGKNDT